jgi:hypothetical protein
MPRYFFDIEDNGELTVDDEGLELSSEKAVRDEAIRALPELAKDELPDGAQHSFWVKVRDESGAYIFQASLELKSGWLKANDTDQFDEHRRRTLSSGETPDAEDS